MIGSRAALDRLKAQPLPLESEPVDLAHAAGRILAQALASPVDLPPFDNAAMDGFAFASRGVPQPAGREWTVEACIAAGESPVAVGAGAVEIMTGAILPAGADTVVPVERIERLDGTPDRIRLLADLAAGANVRRRGEDVAAGQQVLAAGQPLHAPAILLLAGLGLARVEVVRRPRVAVLATGRELVAPGQALPPGRIHDSSSAYLAVALAAAGADVVQIERVGDDVGVFHAALDRALAVGVDLVLSTGGVSSGRYDFVPQALADRHADPLFHGVAWRPGKPVLAARLREGPLFVGLPGNPLSTAVGLRFLVEPMLRRWLGMPDEPPCWLPLAAECSKRVGLHACFHADVRVDAQGRACVQVGQRQESFRLLPLLQASAWVSLPESVERIPAGELVAVYGRGHLQPPVLAG